jgi:hypothetical protein
MVWCLINLSGEPGAAQSDPNSGGNHVIRCKAKDLTSSLEGEGEDKGLRILKP